MQCSSMVIDIAVSSNPKIDTSTRRRALVATACLLTLAIPGLWGGTMLKAVASGSTMALAGTSERPRALQLRTGAYCSGVAEGLERANPTGTAGAAEMYWTVRRFGGRLMKAGTTVELLENRRGVVQVRDLETATICYLEASTLDQDAMD